MHRAREGDADDSAPRHRLGARDTAELDAAGPTATMNLAQLMRHLEATVAVAHDGREAKTEAIIDWFKARAYMVGLPLQGYLRRATYLLALARGDAVDSASMRELRSRLANEGSFLQSAAKEAATASVAEHQARVDELTELAHSCLTIKYLDGVNRLWSAPWHIQARTPIVVFCGGEWRVTTAMPRGPEVAGDKEHGVTALQDVDTSDPRDLDHFADHYQRIIRAMAEGSESEDAASIEKIICSSKRDGMCFRVSIFRRGSAEHEFWAQALRYVDDPWQVAFAGASKRCDELDGAVVLPASNGTALLTTPSIQDWMACSIAMSYGVSHDELVEMARSGQSNVDVLAAPGRRDGREGSVLSMLIDDLASLPRSEAFVEMHAFEAIGGPNRACAFDASAHVELASAYPEDQCGISYLGRASSTAEGDPVWTPHFEMVHPFFEPAFWRIRGVVEAVDALSDLSRVFAGTMPGAASRALEEQWPAFNAKWPIANEDPARAMQPDPEGFVAYFQTMAFGRSSLVYCKAKTWLFYALHKIKTSDIPTILGMPEEFGNAFPGHKMVTAFFSEKGMASIEAMIADLIALINAPETEALCPAKVRAALSRAPASKHLAIVLNNVLDNAAVARRAAAVMTGHMPSLRRGVQVPDAAGGAGGDGAAGEVERAHARQLFRLGKVLLMKLGCSDAPEEGGEDPWRTRLRDHFASALRKERPELSEVLSKLWTAAQAGLEA